MITKGKVYVISGLQALPIGVSTALKNVFGVRISTILDPSLIPDICSIRTMLIFYLHKVRGMKMVAVSEALCRCSSTIRKQCKEHENRIETNDPDYVISYEAFLTEMIKYK